MRFVFNSDKETLDALKDIQENYKDSQESLGGIVNDAIHFLFQMETLMKTGYKLAIIDPQGQQHIISKRINEEEEDGPPFEE